MTTPTVPTPASSAVEQLTALVLELRSTVTNLANRVVLLEARLDKMSDHIVTGHLTVQADDASPFVSIVADGDCAAVSVMHHEDPLRYATLVATWDGELSVKLVDGDKETIIEPTTTSIRAGKTGPHVSATADGHSAAVTAYMGADLDVWASLNVDNASSDPDGRHVYSSVVSAQAGLDNPAEMVRCVPVTEVPAGAEVAS